MNSRERLIATMSCQTVDHVPLIFNVFGFQPPEHLAWSSQYEEAQRWLSLGVDAFLRVDLPLGFHPDVKVRAWEEIIPGQRFPLMVKEYQTPAGSLRQEVFRSDDWDAPGWGPHGGGAEDLQIMDDHAVSRSRRFLVEGGADLEKITYLLRPPTDEAIADFRERAAVITGQGQELGVLVECVASFGSDMATWLCGVEGMLFLAIDQPDVFAGLMEIIHERDKRITEVALDTTVDLITRSAWYEGTAFWSPKLFRKHFAPHITELATMVHGRDRLIAYIMSAGFMSLLEDLVGTGYDVHYYIDPVQGGADVDLRRVKQIFAGKTAIVGGMNSAVTLERGTRDEIRQAVFDAFEALSPGGGFILSPVDGIFGSTPWSSLEILIEAWREACG